MTRRSSVCVLIWSLRKVCHAALTATTRVSPCSSFHPWSVSFFDIFESYSFVPVVCFFSKWTFFVVCFFVVVCIKWVNGGRWTKTDSPSLTPHSISASSTGECTRNGATANRTRARENFIAPELVRLGCDYIVKKK
jgi:hypothetical protein